MSTDKLVQGIGVNDADYKVAPRVNGKHVRCPYYQLWLSMLYRCYSESHLKRQPWYIGCSVDPRWHSFMSFRSWAVNHECEGKQLDKDLKIRGNKVYGPDTCMFVSPEVNSFIIEKISTNGLPLGVSLHSQSGLYRARYRSFGGEGVTIGYFKDPEEAGVAYTKKKMEALEDLITRETDPDVKEAIRRYFNKQKENVNVSEVQ